MLMYIDTSAFIKFAIAEPETEALEQWNAMNQPEFVSSEILYVEAVRAARTHSTEALTLARDLLNRVTLLEVDRHVINVAADLEPGRLRSLDAIHLASVVSIAYLTHTVLTYDKRLANACSQYGFEVVAPR